MPPLAVGEVPNTADLSRATRVANRHPSKHVKVGFADSKASDRDRAIAVTGVHRRADSIRTSIWYLLRTRSKMPEEMQSLARVGGGSVKVLQ